MAFPSSPSDGPFGLGGNPTNNSGGMGPAQGAGGPAWGQYPGGNSLGAPDGSPTPGSPDFLARLFGSLMGQGPQNAPLGNGNSQAPFYPAMQTQAPPPPVTSLASAGDIGQQVRDRMMQPSMAGQMQSQAPPAPMGARQWEASMMPPAGQNNVPASVMPPPPQQNAPQGGQAPGQMPYTQPGQSGQPGQTGQYGQQTGQFPPQPSSPFAPIQRARGGPVPGYAGGGRVDPWVLALMGINPGFARGGSIPGYAEGGQFGFDADPMNYPGGMTAAAAFAQSPEGRRRLAHEVWLRNFANSPTPFGDVQYGPEAPPQAAAPITSSPLAPPAAGPGASPLAPAALINKMVGAPNEAPPVGPGDFGGLPAAAPATAPPQDLMPPLNRRPVAPTFPPAFITAQPPGIGGNRFGGNQFGGNRFGGNQFGGNQFGASAPPDTNRMIGPPATPPPVRPGDFGAPPQAGPLVAGNNQFGGNRFGGNQFGGNQFGGARMGAQAPPRPVQANPVSSPFNPSIPDIVKEFMPQLRDQPPAAPQELMPPLGRRPAQAPNSQNRLLDLLREYMPQLRANGGPVHMMRGGYPELYNAPIRRTFASGGRDSYLPNDGAGGRSDQIDARLSPGEYVMDSETMALLGDGDNKAGAKKMDKLRESVRAHKGKALAKGKISPPAKKSAAEYLVGNPMGDGLRRRGKER